MIRIIFIDIDGTLFDDDGQVSTENIEAIKKAIRDGVKCVLCTGRPRAKTGVVAKTIGLNNYLVSSNGADIYSCTTKKPIYQDIILSELAVKLYNLACSNGLRIKMQSGFNSYVNIIRKSQGEEIFIENINDVVSFNTISQCVIIGKNVDSINKVKEEILKTKGIKIVNQTRALIDSEYKLKPHQELYLDITLNTTSKGNAIRVLCNKLNIDLKEAVAIGDHVNDLTMFETVGRSFAMGNANDYTKSKATEITDTNNNNGVAKAIYKILKENKKG